MAEIIDIFPKDVHTRLEFSQQQVKYILDFLGRCTIEYNGEEEPDMAKAVDYVKNDFFKILEKVEGHMKGGVS